MIPKDRSDHGTSTGSRSWRSTAAPDAWCGSAPPAKSAHARRGSRVGTWSSSSAITDSQRVFAFFESSGLYTYDMDGTLLWQKHFGDKNMFAEVGESGSTPVLYGNHLVVVLMPFKLRLPYATALISRRDREPFRPMAGIPHPRRAAHTGRQARLVGARAAHCWRAGRT